MSNDMPIAVSTEEKTEETLAADKQKAKVKDILIYKKPSLLEISTEQLLMESDADLLKQHNGSFVTLLSNYVEASKKGQKQKRGMKIAFFVITMLIISILSISFVVTIFVGLHIQSNGSVKTLDLLAPIIASFTSVIVAIIIIPKIIAEYLFDKSEDDRLSKMVSNMQEYDRELRNNRNFK